MKNYARLEDNVVKEVIQTEYEINDLFSSDLKWVLCEASTQVGQVFKNGRFESIASPVVDAALAERTWRNLELIRADYELNKVQDSDPTSVGTVSDWRNYRKLLRALPQHPDFPSVTARPLSP